MDNCETTQAILNWTAVFIRLSMSSFLRYVHTSGLSLGQMALLMHLYYHGPREVMACGDLMQLSPAGASQMIERLVQQGLVQRGEEPGDRRVRLVHLTAAGRRAMDESILVRQDWIELLVAALTEEQRTAVGQTLDMLTAQAAVLETPES